MEEAAFRVKKPNTFQALLGPAATRKDIQRVLTNVYARSRARRSRCLVGRTVADLLAHGVSSEMLDLLARGGRVYL
jgi:hypothetical protein